jgi:adenine phosphoribosyltransferase
MSDRPPAAAGPEARLRAFIREVPDFPKQGIRFKDITPLLLDPEALGDSIRLMAERVAKPEAVVAIESRGFVFGTGLALHWKVPLVPARKFGKLPGKTVREFYSLEYGEDSLEVLVDALPRGARAVVVDDVLATGGTAAAAGRLVEQLGARIEAMLFLIELEGLGGRERLRPHRVEALLSLDA